MGAPGILQRTSVKATNEIQPGREIREPHNRYLLNPECTLGDDTLAQLSEHAGSSTDELHMFVELLLGHAPAEPNPSRLLGHRCKPDHLVVRQDRTRARHHSELFERDRLRKEARRDASLTEQIGKKAVSRSAGMLQSTVRKRALLG